MTPMSESDRYCIYWLKTYAIKFGDAAPNATERALDQGSIQNQYQTFYIPASMKHLRAMNCQDDPPGEDQIDSDSELDEAGSELNDSGLDSNGEELEGRGRAPLINIGGPVSYQRFCELWGVVFPDLVNRPYRSIMGKCKWCGLIDIGRKRCTDEVSIKYHNCFCFLDL